MSKRSYGFICSLFGFFVLLLSVFNSSDTYAGFKKSSSVYRKAVYSGVKPCYNKGYDSGGLQKKVSLEQPTGDANSGYSYFNGSLFTLTKQSGGLKIPLIGDTSSSNATTNCADLLSVFIDNKIPTSDTQITQEKADILKTLAYNEKGGNIESASIDFPVGVATFTLYSDEDCRVNCQTHYKRTRNINATFQLSFNRNSDNELIYSTGNTNASLPFKIEVQNDGNAGGSVCVRKNLISEITALFTGSDNNCSEFKADTDLTTIIANTGNDLANLIGTKEVTEEDNKNNYGTIYWAICSKWNANINLKRVECTSDSSFSRNVAYDGASNFEKPNWDSASDTILGSLSNNGDGVNTYKNLEFNPDEKYLLYYNYLTNVYGVSSKKIECFDGVQSGKGTQVRLWSKDKYSDYCYVNPENTKKKVYGVAKKNTDVKGLGSISKGYFGVPISFDEMINQMNALSNTDKPDLSQITKSDVNDPRVNEDENKTTCESGSGFSLAWMVCPIINALASTAQDAYEGFIEPTLQVRPELFIQTNSLGESTTEAAWEVFRNFANIGFSIMLLVVILSQVTGFGIDNYGIKKILPKLIVAAILINLSYLICMIFIDLSNIVGSGIKSLFDDLAKNIANTGLNIGGDSDSLAEVNTMGFAAVGALLGIIALGVFSPMTIISILISAIGVVISIFFLFIMLSMRQAGILVLVVISPLAVICYILPGLKKYYSMWFKFFTSLLILYPVIGLLVGAGNFVSSLLINSSWSDDNVFNLLMAIAVGILPVFFIPKVTKGTIAAFGSVGASIAGMGNRLGGRATGAIRGSEGFKRMQNANTARQDRIRAGVDRDGNVRKVSPLGRVLRGGNRGMAGARARYLKNRDSKMREENLMNGGFAAAIAGMESKVDEQEVANSQAMLAYGGMKNNDGKAVNVNDAKSLGTFHKEALERYRNASNKKDKDKAMADVRAAQNLLSKTDGGRSQVQRNLESAVTLGNVDGLDLASSHLMSNFGDLYKSKNRGANELIKDLATAKRDANGKMDPGALGNMQEKMLHGGYSTAGASKYTQESLAGADSQALRRMAEGVKHGFVEGDDLKNIQATARSAVSMYESGKLNAQPEAMEYIRQIAGNDSDGGGASTNGGVTDGGGVSSGSGSVSSGLTTPQSQIYDGDLDENYDVSSRPALVPGGVQNGSKGRSDVWDGDLDWDVPRDSSSAPSAPSAPSTSSAPSAPPSGQVKNNTVSNSSARNGSSTILTGSAAEQAFREGRSNGSIQLPHGGR